jgi:hypothetical protein
MTRLLKLFAWLVLSLTCVLVGAAPVPMQRDNTWKSLLNSSKLKSINTKRPERDHPSSIDRPEFYTSRPTTYNSYEDVNVPAGAMSARNHVHHEQQGYGLDGYGYENRQHSRPLDYQGGTFGVPANDQFIYSTQSDTPEQFAWAQTASYAAVDPSQHGTSYQYSYGAPSDHQSAPSFLYSQPQYGQGSMPEDGYRQMDAYGTSSYSSDYSHPPTTSTPQPYNIDHSMLSSGEAEPYTSTGDHESMSSESDSHHPAPSTPAMATSQYHKVIRREVPFTSTLPQNSYPLLTNFYNRKKILAMEKEYGKLAFEDFPSKIQTMCIEFLSALTSQAPEEVRTRALINVDWITVRHLLGGKEVDVHDAVVAYLEKPSKLWMQGVPRALRSTVAHKVASAMNLKHAKNGYDWLATRNIGPDGGAFFLNASEEEIYRTRDRWEIIKRKSKNHD